MSRASLDAETFSRARTAMSGVRESDFAVLEAVAEIDVAATGYPSVERLLEDLFHVDRRDAKRLVRHAAALLPSVALSGEPLPARAPATADVTATGEIGPAHVDVVLDALDRLARVPGLAPEVLAEAEATLAEAATYLPPRALGKVADRLIATLDPDGVAPDDEAPVDELLLGGRRDGLLTGRFRFHSAADAEARRLACDAGIVPMVLGTRSEPLDVGRLFYTIPEGMRRTLAYRDGGCAFPGCTRRPGRCASHHVTHWADGGLTALDNVTLLCTYHHRLVHQGHWRVHMRSGHPWFTPPRWIDPNRTPRPGGRSCRA